MNPYLTPNTTAPLNLPSPEAVRPPQPEKPPLSPEEQARWAVTQRRVTETRIASMGQGVPHGSLDPLGDLEQMARCPRMWAVTKEAFCVRLEQVLFYAGTKHGSDVYRWGCGEAKNNSPSRAADTITDEWARSMVEAAKVLLGGGDLGTLIANHRQAKKSPKP